MVYVHALGLVGVFAFAAYGAHRAIAARYDIFGVFACGAITAFAGGTVRELFINGTPAYLYDYTYLAATLAGLAYALAVYKYFAKWEPYLAILDAVGMAVVAYIGAARADAAHLGLGGMILLAVLTAAGGSILCDTLCGKRPNAFYKDAYPLAAFVVALAYYALRPASQNEVTALAIITVGFAVRLGSMYLKYSFWKPYRLFHARQRAGRMLQVDMEEV